LSHGVISLSKTRSTSPIWTFERKACAHYRFDNWKRAAFIVARASLESIMHKRHYLALALIVVPVLAQAGDSRVEIGTGLASYYGAELSGNRTASGERFDPNAMTAAHRTLSFGTRVVVTNLANGQEVIVRVNDRGPWSKSRIMDISYAAAKQIGMHRSGTAKVKLELLD
jgi:rare lipoprotein A